MLRGLLNELKLAGISSKLGAKVAQAFNISYLAGCEDENKHIVKILNDKKEELNVYLHKYCESQEEIKGYEKRIYEIEEILGLITSIPRENNNEIKVTDLNFTASEKALLNCTFEQGEKDCNECINTGKYTNGGFLNMGKALLSKLNILEENK